jgi:hypothetical protein
VTIISGLLHKLSFPRPQYGELDTYRVGTVGIVLPLWMSAAMTSLWRSRQCNVSDLFLSRRDEATPKPETSWATSGLIVVFLFMFVLATQNPVLKLLRQ